MILLLYVSSLYSHRSSCICQDWHHSIHGLFVCLHTFSINLYNSHIAKHHEIKPFFLVFQESITVLYRIMLSCKTNCMLCNHPKMRENIFIYMYCSISDQIKQWAWEQSFGYVLIMVKVFVWLVCIVSVCDSVDTFPSILSPWFVYSIWSDWPSTSQSDFHLYEVYLSMPSWHRILPLHLCN